MRHLMQGRRISIGIQVQWQAHLQHLSIHCHEGPISGTGLHTPEAGEAAKRRDQRSGLPDDEAGKGFPLQPPPHEGNARVDVPGQPVSITTVHRLMSKYKGWHEGWRVDAVDPQVTRRI